MKIIEQLELKTSFTNSEKSISAYILEHISDVITMPLPELAKKSYSSQATIIRLCRKLGCQGYSHFKICLTTELGTLADRKPSIEVNVPFNRQASDKEIIENFYHLSQQSLKNAYENLNLNQLRRAAQLINQSNSVAIYGRGESLLLAEDFRHKLLRIGIHADTEIISGFESYRTRQKYKKEVAVIVSHYVDTIPIGDVFRDLNANHIPIILICGDDKSPLLKKATVVIHVTNEETRYKIGSFASRTAMLLALDCIYGLVFIRNYLENITFIRETEERIQGGDMRYSHTLNK